jgi:hypothetical protein
MVATANEGRGVEGVIEVRLRTASQLFDSMDPAPFNEKELNGAAEEYLVETAKEQSSGVLREIVLYFDCAQSLDEEAAIGAAIQAHFRRRSRFLQAGLRRLLKRGVVSLVIGLSFLALMFVASQAIGDLMKERSLARILREGLLIIGWVAMWKPLEILLYDWWPILSERRLFDRLSRLPVRVVAAPPS